MPPPPSRSSQPTAGAPGQAAHAAPRVVQVREVAKQTGANSVNRTDTRWQVDGTDLGIMWESGPGEVA
ncbi:carbohydrate-binding protein, partial [Nocardia farcinica]|nr:carbohydrate-binding protein [Nocardia farcinica]